MFYRLLLFLVLLGAPQVARGQAATNHDGPLSDRLVSYSIDATLDPATRTVKGAQRLTWRNPGATPVDELQFHLYLNAFKPGSTFQKESGGVHRGFSAEGDDVWGGITVTRMRIAPSLPADLSSAIPYGGEEEDLTERIRFIQPDDGNPDDQTVISVTLPKPVGPGETIALDIDFDSVLPKITARTGYEKDSDGNPFFMVAQWFPKIGVYEVPGQRYVPADAPTGSWNTHQFHANSEFYANFGTYDVRMTVPQSYVVGASGIQTDEAVGDGSKTVTFRADDVHDFAWTAYEHYQVTEQTWRHVKIRALIRPEHAGQAQRHIDAAVAALERYDDWVGEYPYTTLTLVDGIGGSNGMEYPTLITCGTVYMLPSWARALEMVTIHEFGHQYFYGLLASNEFEEAWLDEGMNSYVESRILDDAYGPGSVLDLRGLPIGDRAMQKLSYTQNRPERGVIFSKAWEHQFSSDYGKASYAKPATIMNTLESYLGWETMRQFLRTYFARWRFNHPTTRDLQDVAEEVSGQDLDWFFDQFVYSSAVVDYEVTAIENVASNRSVSPDSTDRSYTSTVTVHRVKNGYFPTTLRVTFSDRTVEDVAWDGKDEWKRFTFNRTARVNEAWIDPDGALWLETERLNNRRSIQVSESFAQREKAKFTTRFQQLIHVLTAFF